MLSSEAETLIMSSIIQLFQLTQIWICWCKFRQTWYFDKIFISLASEIGRTFNGQNFGLRIYYNVHYYNGERSKHVLQRHHYWIIEKFLSTTMFLVCFSFKICIFSRIEIAYIHLKILLNWFFFRYVNIMKSSDL